jgi:hypothetical protein
MVQILYLKPLLIEIKVGRIVRGDLNVVLLLALGYGRTQSIHSKT